MELVGVLIVLVAMDQKRDILIQENVCAEMAIMIIYLMNNVKIVNILGFFLIF